MKERPILFSAPMVRAILDGRKTQTRRIVKMRHRSACPWKLNEQDNTGYEWVECGNEFSAHDYRKPCRCIECPYGEIGDKLWVRETFAADDISSNGFIYRQNWPLSKPPQGWTPSIFMPRKASRITLEITTVRVERLNFITEQDALAEGIDTTEPFKVPYRGEYVATPELRYIHLWESINGKGSWEKNPWVWVIEFKRIA